jgi:PIN domain nuclease of toxin-antitoxin system
LLQAAGAGPLAVSAVTLWEIAMLVVRGRIASTDAIDPLERDPRFLILPLDGRVATESAGLCALRDPAHHRDRSGPRPAAGDRGSPHPRLGAGAGDLALRSQRF